jgi:hypothetical protein
VSPPPPGVGTASFASIPFTSPKSSTLADVAVPSSLAHDHVRGLHVAVHEPGAVSLLKGAADLLEDEHDAPRRERARVRDEIVEVAAVEVLHRVVEDPLGRAPVVVDRDRARVREASRRLHFALEAKERRFADLLGQEQLDRRVPAQERVARAVDAPHATLADHLFEHVLAQPARLLDLAPQAVNAVRGERRHERRHGLHAEGDESVKERAVSRAGAYRGAGPRPRRG